VYFVPPLKGFSLELRTEVTDADGATRPRKKFEISAVWIQYTNETDGQTDGRRATTANICRLHNFDEFFYSGIMISNR